MKTARIIEAGWVADYGRQTVETGTKRWSRACRRDNAGVIDSGLSEGPDRARRELFAYARREVARTRVWERAVVAVLIVASWGAVVVAIVRS